MRVRNIPLAIAGLALSACTMIRRPPPVGPAATTVEPEQPVPPAGAVPTPGRPPSRPARGVVTDAEKPEWMRELVMPDLPLRWYPRVTQYLELYKNDARYHEIMRGWLRRLGAYRALMEAALAKEGLPKGLIFVAMIESGFTSGALSSRGAGGFWQFVPDVARAYGLEVSFWVDERRDPERSTAAAARYLSDLHHRFGNWELALAGYNAGVFAVLDSIVRYNTNDFWTLCRVEAGLPYETTEYVPKVLAVAIVERNRAAFGFDETSDPPGSWDYVQARAATSFESLGARAGVTSDELFQWNPIYVRRRTPPDRPGVRLRVPAGSGDRLGRAFAAVRPADLLPAVIGAGQTVTRIAKARRVSATRLRRLNAITDDAEVTPGTTLLVPRAGAKRQ